MRGTCTFRQVVSISKLLIHMLKSEVEVKTG